MEPQKVYRLPELKFQYNELQPYMSEEQLRIHHQKHHQSYVNGANSILEKLEKARKENLEIDMKSTLKELSFNIGGHILHSLFWENLTTPDKCADEPFKTIGDVINKEFGTFERFKKEFAQAALSVEGSGWVALAFCKKTGRPLIMQIEKHNVNIYPTFQILMILDVFEHAYYIDYKNDRAKFIEAFWKIVDWSEVNRGLEETIKA
jgi:Fe-Mn family superoxide dismutase